MTKLSKNIELLPRLLLGQIEERLFKGKIILIYGARQVGKTTLVKQILAKNQQEGLYLNCEILSVTQALSIPEPAKIKEYFGNHRLVVLDEAQKIPNIGLVLKVLVDTYPELQIIATGSSSFELANQASEPLTGRVDKFLLYPFSLEEIDKQIGKIKLDGKLESLMRYGAYPEIYFLPEKEAKDRLNEISSNYLYKDILNFEKIKKSRLLIDLLQLLALQIGNEVSYYELAKTLGVSRLTVQKYINLLEQTFVVFTLRAFSRNLRKEISKSVKIYFYDLGIRNSLIQNYNPLAIRNDVGALWENLMIMERIKRNAYHKVYANCYFWRTYDQKEIDYVEDREGELFAFEIKWKEAGRKKPKEFLGAYPGAEFKQITKDNFWDFTE